MRSEYRIFWLDVAKSFIDKALIGGIVGLAILLSTQWLEKTKLIDSSFIEINKTKLEKLAEVWEQAYLLDEAFPKYGEVYTEIDHVLKDALKAMQSNLKNGGNPKKEEQRIYSLEAKVKKEYSKKLAIIQKEHLENFKKILGKNKFWIEDKYLTTLDEYSKVVSELARLNPLTNTNSIEKVKALENKLNELSVKINDVRNEILHDGI